MTPEQREALRYAAWDYRTNPNPSTAAAFYFACKPTEIESLIAQVEALTVPQVDADYENVFQVAITELVMRHIDRMNDVCDEDTADRIVNSFVEGFNPCFEVYMAAKFPERAAMMAIKTAPTIPAIPGTKEGA